MAKDKNKLFYPYMMEIGFRIAIPLIVFVLLGNYLDNKFQTGHTLLFLGIFISLFTSVYGIYKTIRNIDKGGR